MIIVFRPHSLSCLCWKSHGRAFGDHSIPFNSSLSSGAQPSMPSEGKGKWERVAWAPALQPPVQSPPSHFLAQYEKAELVFYPALIVLLSLEIFLHHHHRDFLRHPAFPLCHHQLQGLHVCPPSCTEVKRRPCNQPLFRSFL